MADQTRSIVTQWLSIAKLALLLLVTIKVNLGRNDKRSVLLQDYPNLEYITDQALSFIEMKSIKLSISIKIFIMT
jgi:hypothetical protein